MGGDSQGILCFSSLIWPEGAFLLPVRQIWDAAQTGGMCWRKPPWCTFADDSAPLRSFENDISRDVTSFLPGFSSKVQGGKQQKNKKQTKKQNKTPKQPMSKTGCF